MKSLWMLILAFILLACASAIAGEKESNIVAMTILGEARGEGEAGMYAVACVIQERIKSKHWPKIISSAAFSTNNDLILSKGNR